VEERGRAIGTWSGFSAITMAFGPVLGGWLIQHASWRWIFFINVPIAAAVVLISLWRVPESHGAGAKRLDWLGAFVVTIGLGTLIYGLIESPQLGWGHPKVYVSLIAAVLCLVSFPFIESRTDSAMVPLNLFRSRTFSGANLLTLFMYAALGIFFFIFPMNLILAQGYSATAAGAATLPLILLMFLLSRWSGGLVARYGSKLPLMVGPTIAAVGFALFAVPSIGGSYWNTFFPAFLILGFGMSVSVPPLTTAVMGAVDQNHAGAASGINNAVARVAGLLAIAVFGIVMVQAFAVRLEHVLAGLDVSPAARNEMQANRTKLAAIDMPADLGPDRLQEVKAAVSESFVFAFRVVACSCAMLALASAFVSSLFIEGKSKTGKQSSDAISAAAD
jgi:MFS family permease